MNIYTEAHMGALHYAAESQKCIQLILLPSSVSPNSPSINSPLKTQTHPLLPPLRARRASRSRMRSKESARIQSALKTFFEEAKKAQSIPECVCE